MKFLIFYPFYLLIIELAIFVRPDLWILFLFLLLIFSFLENLILNKSSLFSFYFFSLNFYSALLLTTCFFLPYFFSYKLLTQIFIVIILILKFLLTDIFLNKEKTKLLFPNFIYFLSILIIFLLTALLYYVKILSSWPFWVISLIFLIITFLLLIQTFKIYSIRVFQKIQFILIPLLILFECFLVLSFFPFEVFTLAGILTLLYYFVLGIIRQYLVLGEKALTRKVWMRYILVFFTGMLAILITVNF